MVANKKKMMDISNHELVPKHTKVTEKEKQKILDTYKIDFNRLPKILITDPALRGMDPKIGDVIKIVRKSQTSGTTVFYRGVVND